MRVHRPAAQRGHVQAGWLDSWHTFSFGHYHDPAWMGFGPLRVINEDRVAPGAGFPPHRHANMEILSLVLSGRLQHRDSTGGGGVIGAGDIQWMSAGHGVEHSEFNASDTEPVHFLQVWIQPDRSNAAPAYAERQGLVQAAGEWTLLASPDGEDGSLPIRQDARLRAIRLDAGQSACFELDGARRYWLHLATGHAMADGVALHAGDALGFAGEARALEIDGQGDATQALLFDLPA